MNILHLEASHGWGGQEMRILKEAIGMRKKGYQVFFAVANKGGLYYRALEQGFVAYEVNFKKPYWMLAFVKLMRIMRKHNIDLVNTHSSADAWLGGIAARVLKKPLVRTRHLSTAIRKGMNSRLLYHKLADYVVTTCERIVPLIVDQSGKDKDKVLSIPTGVDTSAIQYTDEEVQNFRKLYNIADDDILVGTVCFMRSWKGIDDFLKTADKLKSHAKIKWVIIGGGHYQVYRVMAKEMGLEDHVIFAGHLKKPFAAIRSLDIFTLLSTAHEGVSQASLQASYLEKPLITTPTGGLCEVCIEGVTGIQVPCFSSDKVAEAVLKLAHDADLRKKYGQNARMHVENNFNFSQTLNQMEKIYKDLLVF